MEMSGRKPRDNPYTQSTDQVKIWREERIGLRAEKMYVWADRQVATRLQKLTHKCGNGFKRRKTCVSL